MLNSIYYYLGYNSFSQNNNFKNSKIIINVDDIKKVKLKKTKFIKQPAFARYAQTGDFNLLNLSQQQLDTILKTKLKHITPNKPKTIWEPEHPVLNELLKKTKRY
jgi:hypothetical protein